VPAERRQGNPRPQRAAKRAVQANVEPASTYRESPVPEILGVKDAHATSLRQVARGPNAPRDRTPNGKGLPPSTSLNSQPLDQVGFAKRPRDAILEVALVEAPDFSALTLMVTTSRHVLRHTGTFLDVCS
jgi:hypothetical protein